MRAGSANHTGSSNANFAQNCRKPLKASPNAADKQPVLAS
jgi:hypothetical protein